jgi:Eukaryotic integral membrane protein (DUF1751)
MFFTNPNQDVGSRLTAWWTTVPVFTRLVLYLTLILYTLSLFSAIAWYLVLIPGNVIYGYYIWTIFTFPYINPSIFGIFFSLISYLPTASITERRLGTIRYMSFFIQTNAIIGIVATGLIYLLSLAPLPILQNILGELFCGLWPIIMVEMVINFNKEPERLVQFMCFPFSIKMKYYPWMLFLFFSILFGILWSLLFGIIVGYLRNIYLDLLNFMKYTYINHTQATKIENKIGGCFKTFGTFVETAGAGNEESGSPPAVVPANTSNQSRPPLVPFSGPGYRLGEDLPPQSNNYAKFGI